MLGYNNTVDKIPAVVKPREPRKRVYIIRCANREGLNANPVPSYYLHKGGTMKFYPTKYEHYWVTEDDRVWSDYVVGGQGKTQATLREHKSRTDKDGYKEACLTVGYMKKKYVRVHRLVYEAIIGDIPNLLTIDHIDGNPANNNVHNLRLLSREHNTRIATRKPITIILDSEIFHFNSNKEAIKFLGVSESSYTNFKKGRTSQIKKYKNRELEIIEGATTIETVSTMQCG